MITTLEIATILFSRVNNSVLKTAINGGVYKDQRPTDSNKEDIVVNVVTSDAEMIQRAVGNVNIHVPALSNGMPNHLRFTLLTELATPVLKEGYGATYNFWTESQGLIESNGFWYYNFRIRFKQHNTNLN